MVIVAAMAVTLIGTTALATENAFATKKKHYDKNQATSLVNSWIGENKIEAWSLYKYGDWSQWVHLIIKEEIAALILLKECNEVKFALLEIGPSVSNLKQRKRN